jgi:hypothetical protein
MPQLISHIQYGQERGVSPIKQLRDQEKQVGGRLEGTTLSWGVAEERRRMSEIFSHRLIRYSLSVLVTAKRSSNFLLYTRSEQRVMCRNAECRRSSSCATRRSRLAAGSPSTRCNPSTLTFVHRLCASTAHSDNSSTESCTERYSSLFKNICLA